MAIHNKKTAIIITLLVSLGCVIMACIELFLMPGFLYKSFLKLIIFLIIPFLFCFINKEISFKDLFRFDAKSMLFSFSMGIGVYVFIVGAYFLFGGFFDLSNITTSLNKNLGINKSNFIYVSVYISFVNSLLEEFFFRGFAFIALKKLSGKKTAYMFSALSFSIYHIAIFNGWFSIWLGVLLVISLFISCLFFNFLNDKKDTIYNSWLVHMFANFAINTIGFILFSKI